MKKLVLLAACLMVASVSFAQTTCLYITVDGPAMADPLDPAASDEAAVVDRLTSAYGLVVTAADPGTLIGSDADAYDLVVVAESVTSGSVADRFNAYAGPLITMESYILDDLGLAAGSLGSTADNADSSLQDFGHQNGQYVKIVGSEMANTMTGNVQLSDPEIVTDPPPVLLLNYSSPPPASAVVTGTIVRDDPAPALDDPNFACYFSVPQGGALDNGQGTAAGLRICHWEHRNFLSLNADGIMLWDGAFNLALGISVETPTPSPTPGPTPTPGPNAAQNWEAYQ